MSKEDDDLDHLVDTTEQIGVIGSPSSTAELALDILGSAVTKKLVGELALFRFQQDIARHYGLGQITEIKLRNMWHEDPTMRSLIRQRGKIDAVSERQDTHLGQMTISAVFRELTSSTFEPSILGTVPATGTPIHIVTDPVLDRLLSVYRQQMFYLGRIYGSQPRLPLWFKHFDHGADGAGEAYHLGIFGKTGSGKSVLAKMILLAYARHSQMAILIIDPQGEFAKDARDNPSKDGFALNLGSLIKTIKGRADSLAVLSVRQLVLDRWELLQQILEESRFFRELQILTSDKVATASEQLVYAMRKKRDINLASLHLREVFDSVWQLLRSEKLRNKIYAREGDAARRFEDAINEADVDALYKEIWLPLARLFQEDKRSGRRKIEEALQWLLAIDKEPRPVLIIDVSKEQAGDLLWNERIQSLVIKRVLQGVAMQSEKLFKENTSLNALVILDEAHRFAPRDLPLEDATIRGVRSTLVDAARTTRKYGLGWMFISQTLSSIHPEILQQLRIFFFGFGLSMGLEYMRLRELVGSIDTALDLYRLFRDPHSAFDIGSRQYSFMTVGPVSPLSFAGTPLFLNAYNTVDEFLSANDLAAI